ncbi:MAG TPA: MarR family transcriptional regulator [Thermoanaerobaculia bacterium]|nr:MarR family transcriptional regulator [Thermoanaerobaculia bacterium]
MPARRTLDDDANSILDSLRRLSRALRLSEKEAQSRYGLTAAQLVVLHVLHDNPDCSLGELAAFTATDQSTSSVVVQRLVEAGYVSRVDQERDRRHVSLKLTPAGRALATKSPLPLADQVARSLAQMRTADRAAFVSLFDAFLAGLDE